MVGGVSQPSPKGHSFIPQMKEIDGFCGGAAPLGRITVRSLWAWRLMSRVVVT
jgi:hypothetical protein